MRLVILLLAVLCLWAQPAQAAFAHVQTVTETTDQFSGDATVNVTVSATTVGNLIVVVTCSGNDRTISSISGGATYTELHRTSSGTTWNAISAGIATSSVTTVTVQLNANSDGALPDSVTVMEFSGPLSPFTESGTSTGASNGSGTTHNSSGDVTPDTNETLFIGVQIYSGSTGGLTTDADYVEAFEGVTANHRVVAYRIQSGSTTAQGFTCTTVNSRTSVVSLAAVRGDLGGGGGGSVPKSTKLNLTGVGN